MSVKNSSSVDMSVVIKRNPTHQTYRVDMLVVKDDGAFESKVCRNLIEVMQAITDFEAKHMSQFDGDIEYRHINWRELARQNREGRS